MGLIISRFRRKKSTTEVLEDLDTKIKSIEQDGHNKQLKHKRVLSYVMAYSVALYLLFAVLYYYIYAGRSQHWLHSILHASPLLVLPILIIFLRSTISWYYNITLEKNKVKLKKMREEKKKILETVMDTETYKVAKEILDRFGKPEDQMKALKPFVPTKNVPGNSNSMTPNTSTTATPGQLRQRQLLPAGVHTSTPISNRQLVPFMNKMPRTQETFGSPRLPSNKLPRPISDIKRSVLDKMVDFLMRDGPNHRMALICSGCQSHNGMALEEEFVYVSYICAYCGHLNPARKKRPIAPELAAPSPRAQMFNTTIPKSPQKTGSSSSSESEAEVQALESNDKDKDDSADVTLTPEAINEIDMDDTEEVKKQTASVE